MSTRPKKKKGWWERWGFIILPLFIIGFLGLLFLGVDQLCVNDANRRLPRYPDAVRVQENYNGLRLRGIGNSLEVVTTEASVQEIKAWYEQNTLELLNSGRFRGLNNVSQWTEETDEGETQIFYLSQCVM